jgi:hypothetical protein
LLIDGEVRVHLYQSRPDKSFLFGRDPIGEKPPVLSVDYDFGFRTALKIEVPRRMHVVAAKGRNNNEIGSILEIENRGASLASRYAASRSEHHERRCSERVP